jgi:ribosome maturation factor RimP
VSDLPARVAELAEQAAAADGVEVLEAHLTGGADGRVLRVVLDADDPVEADVVEQVARRLSRTLDAEDPIPGRYTLEVATPGLDRALRSARDFRRQLGHPVRVQLAEGTVLQAPGGGPARPARQVEGTVLGVDEQAVTLTVAGEPVAVPLAQVLKGKVVLPW